MCRFVLYMGPQITLDLLTTRPHHSIIRQSYQARMRVEPLNGDGFGVAWYVPELSPEPAAYRSIQPAWNNQNLRDLARLTRSPVILAHVRAATHGLGVSEFNCHPFTAGRLAFMHNGEIGDFFRVKRHLQQRLSEETFLSIRGTTDSEHLFALFRDHLGHPPPEEATNKMADALRRTIDDATSLAHEVGTSPRAVLNLAVTDGHCAVASRYVTGAEQSATLFVHTGKQYICEGNTCRMVETAGDGHAVMIASEPLTDETTWMPVPQNHLVLVHRDLSVEYQAMD